VTTIYNETDAYAAQWIRNLVSAKQITPGEVDERSIADLAPTDVAGPGQRHFFAGIGGWSHALRLAGVSDDADIWTGSCPCQGFSSAGKQRGFSDERHLWPVWFKLVRECRPAIVFGEQVASGLGLAWLDLVFADLEGAGYACAAADLPAAGVGSPHKRQRLYFVAYAGDTRPQDRWAPRSAVDRGAHLLLGDPDSESGWRQRRGIPRAEAEARTLRSGDHGSRHTGQDMDPWSGCDWIHCTDGKARPTEPGVRPLAHGVPGRVGRLRGYGNAIVPQIAAAFICAALEAL
jgi:DNA (cytosine-5)-methyltransferase 1